MSYGTVKTDVVVLRLCALVTQHAVLCADRPEVMGLFRFPSSFLSIPMLSLHWTSSIM